MKVRRGGARCILQEVGGDVPRGVWAAGQSRRLHAAGHAVNTSLYARRPPSLAGDGPKPRPRPDDLVQWCVRERPMALGVRGGAAPTFPLCPAGTECVAMMVRGQWLGWGRAGPSPARPVFAPAKPALPPSMAVGWRAPSLQGRTRGVSARPGPGRRHNAEYQFAGRPAPTRSGVCLLPLGQGPISCPDDTAISPPSCPQSDPATHARTAPCSHPRTYAPDFPPVCTRRTGPTAALFPSDSAPGNSCG